MRRFIPAYAGNSDRVSLASTVYAVHPRLRGELLTNFRNPPGKPGSSPLTRGTRLWQILSERLDTVHPRLRGELQTIQFLKRCRYGSSPLTRGTHSQVSCCFHQPRFIPAYAGNSRGFNSICSANSVHPRLRGELR